MQIYLETYLSLEEVVALIIVVKFEIEVVCGW